MKKQPLIITIAALVLLAGVAYLAGSINTAKDKVGAQNSNTQQIKKYANSEAGYSLEYPANWTIDISSGGNPAMFYDPVSKQQQLQTELMQGSKIEIYYESSNGKTLEDAVKEKQDLFPPQTKINVFVDQIPAIRTTGRGAYQAFDNTVFLISNGKLIWISQYIPVDNEIQKYTKIFDEMLESFTLN